MKWITLLIVPLAIVLALYAAIPFRSSVSRIDAVTGTTEIQVTWLSFIKFRPEVQPSAIDSRLRQIGFTWKPDWRLLSDYDESIFHYTRNCSEAPPIYELRVLMKAFVARTNDAELRKFISNMQTGTDTQQKAMVEEAKNRALGESQ